MMARGSRKSSKRGDARERKRSETPSILTAAGLLAFYEEEQARVKITPGVVLGSAVIFIIASIAAIMLH